MRGQRRKAVFVQRALIAAQSVVWCSGNPLRCPTNTRCSRRECNSCLYLSFFLLFRLCAQRVFCSLSELHWDRSRRQANLRNFTLCSGLQYARIHATVTSNSERTRRILICPFSECLHCTRCLASPYLFVAEDWLGTTRMLTNANRLIRSRGTSTIRLLASIGSLSRYGPLFFIANKVSILPSIYLALWRF